MSNVDGFKPYSITFEHRPGYLYAYIAGPTDSYEISRMYWQEVALECKKKKYKKILVDEDLREQVPSMSEVFQFASEQPFMGLTGLKIAFFDRHADQQDLNEFGEMVAINRGLLLHVFDDLDSAERWLTTGDDL